LAFICCKDTKKSRHGNASATKNATKVRKEGCIFPCPADKNFFSASEIYFKGFEIYFRGTKIYFQATEIVLLRAAVEK